jgi:hypothetical protein
MGRFYNNRGMSAHILRATNTGNRNCFPCGPRQTNSRNNRTSIARQRNCKHASLTKDVVLRGVCAEKLSWRQSALWVSQFSVGDSHGKFIVEEELEVDLWWLNVWFEDFIYGVVQWYLECDSYSSSYVKIRCQKRIRKTLQRNCHCLDPLRSND